MITPDDIFRIADGAAFDAAALEIFRRQARECAPYREYLARIGVRAEHVDTPEKIPYLPIELFKTHTVYCGETPPEAVFTSSATTGMTPSRHPMRSLALYEQAFRTAFRNFYGDPAGLSLYALLPNYLRRKGSSLVYMADRLIADCGSGGFYLDDCEGLLAAMERDPKPKILLGVSYALWDLAERYAPKLRDTVVMETGGMKGYREEIPKEEFHRILCDAFGVGEIHSEYGMAELTSQAYSQGGNVFRCPGWMRVTARDVNDPFDPLPAGARGGLNIADLVVVRLYPDTGRGARRRGRRVRHRRPYRPFGHPGLQSSGTMKCRLKYRQCIAAQNAVSTAFRRVCKSAPPLTTRPGREVERRKRQRVATNPFTNYQTP
jgi:hypothetical protein